MFLFLELFLEVHLFSKYYNYDKSILTNNELFISPLNYYYRIQYILRFDISYHISICFIKYKNIIIPQLIMLIIY